MQTETDLEMLCRVGLEPVYTKARKIKRILAYEYCQAILGKVDDWESHWKHAKRAFDRSGHYGQWIIDADLSDIDKIVFFWKILGEQIKKNTKDFSDAFPEQFHYYNEENFKKLCEWLDRQRWTMRVIDSMRGTDAETAIMSALKNGEGDSVGY